METTLSSILNLGSSATFKLSVSVLHVLHLLLGIKANVCNQMSLSKEII